jgi:hypothetical protein
LHLELGLLRLVHAGRLQPIEDVIRSLGKTGGPPAPAPQARTAPPAPKPEIKASVSAAPRPPALRTEPARPAPAPETPPASPSAAAEGTLKDRLVALLRGQKKTFTADAVEHAEVVESGGTIEFRVSRQHMLSLRGPEIGQSLEGILGRQVKVKVTVTETAAPAPAAEARPQGDEETMKRALEHPEVKKAQELFPGSAVRSVRDLKE